MEKKAIILPYLPEQLEKLNDEENRTMTESKLYINSTENLKEHMDIIYLSLGIFHDLMPAKNNKTEQDIVVEGLAIRIFNSVTSSIKLMLSGYYQNAFMMQRDILESGWLMDFFYSNGVEILKWKTSSYKERKQNYNPGKIRDSLDSRDNFPVKKREEIYKAMCNLAAHPTYDGFRLISKNNTLMLGPFFEAAKLRSAVEELAMRFPHLVLVFSCFFQPFPKDLLQPQNEYLAKLRPWLLKYKGVDLGEDVENIIKLNKLLLMVDLGKGA